MKYSDFLILNHADASDVLIFILLIIFYSLVITAIAFISQSIVIVKDYYQSHPGSLKNHFMQGKFLYLLISIFKTIFEKDILYLIRSPKMFSIYITPILFTSVIEIRNKFVSSEHLLPIFITVLLWSLPLFHYLLCNQTILIIKIYCLQYLLIWSRCTE